MLQLCPDSSNVSTIPQPSSLAIPLLCPEAAEDDEQLLAWIYSNSLIHDEALASRIPHMCLAIDEQFCNKQRITVYGCLLARLYALYEPGHSQRLTQQPF
ncbi:hypothetical protein GEMRC1_006127 [Eukaryota sp. GEM-RC1]